jgi:hypothetical protein
VPDAVIETGEHPRARQAMDDLQRRMVSEGMSPAAAEKRARETARRMDRKNNGRP